MATSLFNSSWHRVAKLKLRIKDEVLIKRQIWRDELWYLLCDDLTAKTHRVNINTYQFIGRCDGNLTVQQVWDALLLEKGDDAPTQDEVIGLIAQLNQNSLLYIEQNADVSSLFERRKVKREQQQREFLNPFSIKVPLGDPSKWLNKLDHIAQFIFQTRILYLWLAFICIAVLIAGSEWAAITAHAQTHMLTPSYLILSIICFPFIKALHELAHGLAVRRWQGSVHEFGITLLVFVPAPYVDASDANTFPIKSQRMAVSAAGIMVETFLAALAFLVWINVQPGLLQSIAFVTMVIGTLSTILFNGNPLLRFDGYYVFSDWLDIPNLATRSRQYWQHISKSVITFRKPELFEMSHGEKKWLVVYAPLSYAYKCLITIVITLWLGGKWLFLGLAAALYMTFSLVIKPINQWTKQVIARSKPGKDLDRTYRRLALVGLSIMVGLFVIPLPFSTVAPAVVSLPEQAEIRVQEGGFITATPIQSGSYVKAGDTIAVLENVGLSKQKKKITGMLDGLKADQFQSLLRNPAAAERINQKIQNLQKQLQHINQKIAHLTLVAELDGKLIMPKQQDSAGAYVERGDAIGYVFQNAHIKLRVAVPEKEAYLVSNKTKNIAVWMADNQPLHGKVKMVLDVPSATRTLPTAALGDSAGGPYITDPADVEHKQLLEPVFLFDLTVSNTALNKVGSTAFVKFRHDATPLATQLYHHANQLFIKRFEPST